MQSFTITHCITARSALYTLLFYWDWHSVSGATLSFIAVKQCVIVLHCLRAIGVAIGHRLSGTQYRHKLWKAQLAKPSHGLGLCFHVEASVGETLSTERDIWKAIKKYLDMDLGIFLPEILFFTENSGADSCSKSAPSSPLEVSHKLIFVDGTWKCTVS